MFAILTAEVINDTIMLLTMLRARCCPMVLWKYVFNLRNALNDRSA